MSEAMKEIQDNTLEETSSSEKTTETIVNEALFTFFKSDKILNKTKLSRGSVIRALRAAMHEGITELQFKLKLNSNAESLLAIALHDMLTSRTILQAELLNRKHKEENKDEQVKS